MSSITSKADKPKELTEIQKRNHARFLERQAVLAPLVAIWPRFAIAPTLPALPMTNNLLDVMLADAESKGASITAEQILKGLNTYARRQAYANALAEGGPRYNHLGEEDGEVDAICQQRAIDGIERGKERWKQKRKAMRQLAKEQRQAAPEAKVVEIPTLAPVELEATPELLAS